MVDMFDRILNTPLVEVSFFHELLKVYTVQLFSVEVGEGE